MAIQSRAIRPKRQGTLELKITPCFEELIQCETPIHGARACDITGVRCIYYVDCHIRAMRAAPWSERASDWVGFTLARHDPRDPVRWQRQVQLAPMSIKARTRAEKPHNWRSSWRRLAPYIERRHLTRHHRHTWAPVRAKLLLGAIAQKDLPVISASFPRQN